MKNAKIYFLIKEITSSLFIAWRIVWRTGLFFIVWGAMLALYLVPFGSKLSHWAQKSPIEALLFTNIVIAITILAATWLMTRFIDHRPLLSIGLKLDHIFRDLITGLALGVAWLGISIGAAWAFGLEGGLIATITTSIIIIIMYFIFIRKIKSRIY